VTVKTADGATPALAALLAPKNGVFGVVADPLLFDRLGIKPGDLVRIGTESYEARAVLVSLPDQAARGFQLGASVLVSTASLSATGILQPGAIARYRYKIDLGAGTYNAAAAAIKTAFPDAGWQIRSPKESTANLTHYIDLFDRFLILVGLSSLLVGGIGVSNAVAAYIGDRERSIATMRSLGATSGRVLFHFLVQIMLLGILGTFAGVVLGAVSTLIALPLLSGYLSIDLPAGIYAPPLATAVGFGLLISFTFAFLPLIGATRLRPAALFRAAGGLAEGQRLSWRDLLGPRVGLPLALGALAILGLALLTAGEPLLVLWYAAGAIVSFLLLRLAAWILQRLIRVLPPLAAVSGRMALRNIHRPGAPTPTVILSLGLGLTLMLIIALIDTSVRGQLDGQMTASAPSFVLMNVDKGTMPALEAFAGADKRVTSLEFTPFLRGIVTKARGEKIADMKDLAPDVARRFGGDQALSWRKDLPPGDSLIEGKWWDADYKGAPLLSLDEDFARPLNLAVGDSVEIAISGRPIAATVANIRHIDWHNSSLSFTILFSPGLIEAAPSTYMGSLKARPDDVEGVQATMVKDFPTLGFVPVGDALAQFSAVIGSLANAVAIVGGVALISGVFVLAGALAAGRRQREADAIVTKVLGATRFDIGRAYLIEYGVLGLLATAVAAGLGTLGAWAIVTKVLQLSFALDWPLIAEVALGAMVATVATGLVTTWSALSTRPAAYLRADE
jgi:putative ABC transport system permease protein